MSDHHLHFRKLADPSAQSAPDVDPNDSGDKDLRLELLWGAERIAAELNVTTRRAFYLLEHGEIPAQKVGGRWCASRHVLRKRFGVG